MITKLTDNPCDVLYEGKFQNYLLIIDIMHCDDKRTKYSLEQFIKEAKVELLNLEKKNKSELNLDMQKRIQDLKNGIRESEEQLTKMS